MEQSSNLSPIRTNIEQDIKSAMKSGDKFKLMTLRMTMAAIKQVEIDERINLSNERVIGIIKKSIKQRQESIKQFVDANRNELAEKERSEINILENYLPADLSESEVDLLIAETIKQTGATSIKEMGIVIKILKEKTASRADMALISKKVKNILL